MTQTRLSGSERATIAANLLASIEQVSATEHDEGHRHHLGASVIGEPCTRKLVYGFRWFHREQFNGRMRRLFQRGHDEEGRFVSLLRAAGCHVWEVDATGAQFRVATPDGHAGGSMDGVVRLPGCDIAFLLEMKTHSLKSFKDLQTKGMRASKPKHYAQMCMYGVLQGFCYGVYMAVNKNDDELHIEVVELDREHGQFMLNKAYAVIYAKALPPKIAATGAYQECKFCAHSGHCHGSDAVERNCRSCMFSVPIENAKWFCEWHNRKLVDTDACEHWSVFK